MLTYFSQAVMIDQESGKKTLSCDRKILLQLSFSYLSLFTREIGVESR